MTLRKQWIPFLVISVFVSEANAAAAKFEKLFQTSWAEYRQKTKKAKSAFAVAEAGARFAERLNSLAADEGPDVVRRRTKVVGYLSSLLYVLLPNTEIWYKKFYLKIPENLHEAAMSQFEGDDLETVNRRIKTVLYVDSVGGGWKEQCRKLGHTNCDEPQDGEVKVADPSKLYFPTEADEKEAQALVAKALRLMYEQEKHKEARDIFISLRDKYPYESIFYYYISDSYGSAFETAGIADLYIQDAKRFVIEGSAGHGRVIVQEAHIKYMRNQFKEATHLIQYARSHAVISSQDREALNNLELLVAEKSRGVQNINNNNGQGTNWNYTPNPAAGSGAGNTKINPSTGTESYTDSHGNKVYKTR